MKMVCRRPPGGLVTPYGNGVARSVALRSRLGKASWERVRYPLALPVFPARRESPALMLPPSSEFGTASNSRLARFGIWIVVGLYLVAVLAVNPFRECPVRDDWAYAWSAWRLLATGHYQAHDWASANTPFQAAWGAAFCWLFGNSFVALRASTIVLAVLGLFGFRALAREHGLSRGAADLLTLCLASCSIFFKLSLAYMSDVPFASLLTLAVLFYTRAVRTMRWTDWILGSVAGAATVGTRQFGVALVATLGLVWLFDRRRWARWKEYAVGVSLPVLAAAWQVNQGWNHPNWAAGFQVYRARNYFSSGAFFQQLPWRPGAIVEYLAWFLVPLVLLAALGIIREWRGPSNADAANSPRSRRPLATLALWIVVFVLNVVYGWKVLGYAYHTANFQGSHALMPFLPDCYDILEVLGEPVRWAATVFVIVGAALFARLIVGRVARLGTGDADQLACCVLDFTALFLAAISLVFNQFTDNYLVPLVPYAAIAVGKPLAELLWARRRAVVACCLVLFVGAAIWTREDLAKDEAMWSLSARLHDQGIPPQQIFSDWKWFFFWNFEDAAEQGLFHPDTSYAYFFDEWMAPDRQFAEYWVVHDPTPPPNERWEVVDQAHYFTVYARGQETFYAVRRVRKEAAVPSRVAPATPQVPPAPPAKSKSGAK